MKNEKDLLHDKLFIADFKNGRNCMAWNIHGLRQLKSATRRQPTMKWEFSSTTSSWILPKPEWTWKQIFPQKEKNRKIILRNDGKTFLIWLKTLVYVSKKLSELWANKMIFKPRNITIKLLVDKDGEKNLETSHNNVIRYV